MVRTEDVLKFEQDKETAGLTPERINERILEIIEEAKKEFAGRDVKFTPEGTFI